ncbi:MAG: hypothetical protein ACHP6H_05170 [Legionellales bacterium]
MPRKVRNTTYWRLDEIISGYENAIKLLKYAKKETGQKRVMSLLRAHKTLKEIQYECVRRAVAHVRKRYRVGAKFNILNEARNGKAGVRAQERYTIVEELGD